MKFTLLAATALAAPLENDTKDTLDVASPTREAVPDLKDFLFDLYGDDAAGMTDQQILAQLIGSTPAPALDSNEITAPVVDNEIILTTNPLDSSEIRHLEESLLKFKNFEDKKLKNQQLENILTEEMELLASLKKSEMHLKDELRKLDIIKDEKVIAQLTPEDTKSVTEEHEEEIMLTFDIESNPSSSTKLTSISTICMVLVAVLVL